MLLLTTGLIRRELAYMVGITSLSDQSQKRG